MPPLMCKYCVEHFLFGFRPYLWFGRNAVVKVYMPSITTAKLHTAPILFYMGVYLYSTPEQNFTLQSVPALGECQFLNTMKTRSTNHQALVYTSHILIKLRQFPPMHYYLDKSIGLPVSAVYSSCNYSLMYRMIGTSKTCCTYSKRIQSPN